MSSNKSECNEIAEEVIVIQIALCIPIQVQFVVDSVYAFAHALQNLHSHVCPGQAYVCEAMRRYDSGDFYRQYILNVAFTS